MISLQDIVITEDSQTSMVEFIPPVRLLSAKFHRPTVPSTYLPRPSLLEHLNRHRDQPLILVSAPAGYGKTTLLSAWVESSDWPCAWLSLDASDDNLYAFMEHLLGAIQAVFPDAAQDTLLMLRTAPVLPKQVLANSLISALDNLDAPFILALDDYHVIHDPAVHDLLLEVLRYPPQHLHMVLATRYDPPLPVTSLVAKDKLTEIRANDLRFSPDEARALVHRVAGVEIDDATISLIRDMAEGWAAILHLAALSLRQRPGWIRNPRIFLADSYRVTDYLITEVLSQQPPAIHEFLLKTSILDRLSNSLCEAVAGVGMDAGLDVGQTIMDRLIQMGLLSGPVDDTHQWYRHHPIFQELLQDQLRRSSSANSIAGLHRRASAWFVKNGWGTEALHHALTTNDFLAAIRIVSQYRQALMSGEQWGRLDGWVRLFPREVVDAHAELLLSDAWVANSRQRLVELSTLLDRAEAVLAGATPTLEPADALRGEVAALRSAQHYYAGDTARSMTCASLALKLTPHHWSYPRLFGRLFLALGHLAKGETTTALEVAYSSLMEMKDQGDSCKGPVLTTLGLLYWIAADLKALNQVASQLLAIAQSLGRPQSEGFGHYLLGIAYYQRNDLAAAEQDLSAALSESNSITMACFIHSAFALSLTQQALGRPGEARAVADSILPFLLERRCPDLVPAAQAFQAQLALQQGRIAEAVRQVDQLRMPVVLPPMPLFYAPYLTVAKVRLVQDTPTSRQAADDLVGRLLKHAESTHHTRLLIEVLAVQAMLHDVQGDQDAALATLERAIMLAETSGFIRLFADLGPRMGKLLNRLSDRSAAPNYVRQILVVIAQAKPIVTSINQDGLIERLTDRELEVLALLEKRLSDKEIAQLLTISLGTVKRHTHSIFEKLYASNRREAVAKATAIGILPVH